MSSSLPTTQFRASRRFARAATCIAEALFARESGVPPAERIEWFCDDLADFIHHAGTRLRWLFPLGMFAVLWLIPLLLFSRPLPWLSVAKRTKVLARIERSPFGLSMLLVKTMMCVVYFEHPDVEGAIGFDGECLEDPS